MQTNNLIGRGIDDHLIQRPLVSSRQHVLHCPKIAFVDLDIAKLLTRFVFGHANACQRRIAEYSRRNCRIVDGARVVAENGICKGVSFTDGDRGQLDTIGDVADGIDARHIRPVVVTNNDRAVLVERNADFFETEPFGMRRAADGPHQQIGFHHALIAAINEQTPVRLLDRAFERKVHPDIDALFAAHANQLFYDFLIVTAQHFVAARNQSHVNAKFVEYPGKLVRYIPGTRNHHSSGQFG